jgi:hypothetical protein
VRVRPAGVSDIRIRVVHGSVRRSLGGSLRRCLLARVSEPGVQRRIGPTVFRPRLGILAPVENLALRIHARVACNAVGGESVGVAATAHARDRREEDRRGRERRAGTTMANQAGATQHPLGRRRSGAIAKRRGERSRTERAQSFVDSHVTVAPRATEEACHHPHCQAHAEPTLAPRASRALHGRQRANVGPAHRRALEQGGDVREELLHGEGFLQEHVGPGRLRVRHVLWKASVAGD